MPIRRRIQLPAALALLATVATRAPAQRVPSDVTFNLRRDFLEMLMGSDSTRESVGARWTVRLRMDARSRVHALASDCELHIGARFPTNRVIGAPRGIVVEPPNVCKRRLPPVAPGGAISAAWERYVDDHVLGRTCSVSGFPRIFSEHSEGGGSSGSNPDHVVEIHPATALDCGDGALDFASILQYYPGMRAITPASTEACLGDRRLFVRGARQGGKDIYEFNEEGAKGSGGRCGNFVIVDAHLSKDYLRTTSNGGDEIALAQAWVGESGPYPLKIYAYGNTGVGQQLARLREDPDENAQLELRLHGLLTYDYFTIVQSLQRRNGSGGFDWIPVSELEEWREIRRPLALVVFGEVPQQ